ncbi:hypothetical protein ACP275_02G065400 [Erythranthe tilingii]
MEEESTLTKHEMDAVWQLIQLRRSSADDSPAVRPNFAAEKENNIRDGCRGGEGSAAAAEASPPSAVIIDEEKFSDDEEYEALPRRKRKYGSLVEIYKRTRPFNNKKRPRF